MKHELIERTAREWVEGNAHQLPRVLGRTALTDVIQYAQSTDEIAEALIQLAGKMKLAETRLW